MSLLLYHVYCSPFLSFLFFNLSPPQFMIFLRFSLSVSFHLIFIYFLVPIYLQGFVFLLVKKQQTIKKVYLSGGKTNLSSEKQSLQKPKITNTNRVYGGGGGSLAPWTSNFGYRFRFLVSLPTTEKPLHMVTPFSPLP